MVLSKQETQQLFDGLKQQEEGSKLVREKDSEVSQGRYELAARLQYGAGLRLSELVRLRVQDVDVGRGTLTVRQGKGNKDRVTVLPKSLRKEIAQQIEQAREVWSGDRERGLDGVHLPGALSRKVRRAAETFEWFWFFPARQTSVDCESGIRRRHHLHGKIPCPSFEGRWWEGLFGKLPILVLVREGF